MVAQHKKWFLDADVSKASNVHARNQGLGEFRSDSRPSIDPSANVSDVLTASGAVRIEKNNYLTNYYNIAYLLPLSNCEYLLINQRDAANVTFGFLGKSHFFIKVLYANQEVSIRENFSRIFVNQIPKFYTHFETEVIPNEFTVRRDGHTLYVEAPSVSLTSDLRKRDTYIRVKGHPAPGRYNGGLAYETHIDDFDLVCTKLVKLKPYKIDRNCDEGGC